MERNLKLKHAILTFSFFFILFFKLSSQDLKWKNLFNEKDLSSFKILNGRADFKIENGIIIGISKMNTPNTFLATKRKYDDFILEFEAYIEDGLNSGVQFRSNSFSDYKDGRVHGYQCEIETSSRRWSGGIYDEARRGWLYPLTRNPKSKNAYVKNQWNHFRIEAYGNNIRTYVNGIHCTNLFDDLSSDGFIAFQVHSIKSLENEGKKVFWKNIRILDSNVESNLKIVDSNVDEVSYLDNLLTEREIKNGYKLLWDGLTSNGWRSQKNNKFPEKGWKIENGILSVLSSKGLESQNGGDIVTKKLFSNFELSVDFLISKGSNSGIKYFVNTDLNKGIGSAIGLEFQILDDKNHPDAKAGKNGNRTIGSLYDLIRAENSSSGARGKNFKGIGKWNNARIIVKGGKVEHWLNHVKVVEYDRFSQTFKALVEKSKYEKWDNFGRWKSGRILLQDHGDKVLFKNIKIREFNYE
ncbi:MAG: DUF1080 domain-containing protein [Flavobacteriaceae bacterium]|nr:DUF1080 domain-containing protein [Flavobacteriaceae bacterium]